jgi:hypothetical protein
MKRSLVLLAVVLTATPAFAQTTPAPRWEVEGYGGLSLFDLPKGGTAALPPAGPPLTTSGPTTPTRRVPTWFLGDGANLLNAVNTEFGIPARIAPLDDALASLGLQGTNSPAAGIRVRRGLTPRLALEVTADVLPGSRELSSEMRTAVEDARASFDTAFTALFAGTFFTAVSVDATAELANPSSRELATTVAVRWTPWESATRAIAPYLTLGAGLVHQIGDLPSVTMTGKYSFRVQGAEPAAVPFSETDVLHLRYEQGSAAVAVAGAGLRGRLNERLALTLDGRVLLGPQTLTLRLSSDPDVATGTPQGFLESGTTPSIQFSNSANTGRESSLSGDLTGFKAFSTSGTQMRYMVTAGMAIRF